MSTTGRPVRVLQVSPRYLPDLGGIESHVYEVSRRLARRDDIEVSVLATDRSGTLPLHTVSEDGIAVHRVPAWPRDRDYYLAPRLAQVIRSGGWDVVHVQGVHTAVPVIAMAAARAAGLPFVVTFHTGGHSSGLRTRLRAVQWRALAPLLRRADRLVAVSRFERQVFEQAGVGPGRITVIRNGGSLPPVPPGIEPVPGRIVSSGRLERYKGHHRAVTALPLIRQRVPHAHLHILGSGPYEAELRDLAAGLGIADAVTIRLVPPADRAAMATALREASVVAALSDYEAHPVAVMEALALGVPVVGFDVAGIGDLVADGAVRGLRPDARTTEVADRLADTLLDDGPRTIPPLPTWDGAADRLARLYLEVAGRTAAGADGTNRPDARAAAKRR